MSADTSYIISDSEGAGADHFSVHLLAVVVVLGCLLLAKFSHLESLKSSINFHLLSPYSFTLLLPGCCQCNVYGKTSLCKCFYLFSRFCILHDLSKLHGHHSPVSPATVFQSVFHLLEATGFSTRD